MIKRYTTILELLRRCGDTVGKTFLQKVIYVLQDWMEVQLDYDYRLHFYGPYSSELSDDIEALSDINLIDLEYDSSGYGYKIKISESGKLFLDENLEQYMTDVGKIDRAINLFGKVGVRDMELKSTLLYFSKLTNDEYSINKLVNTVKPHFSDSEISQAITQLKGEKILN